MGIIFSTFIYNNINIKKIEINRILKIIDDKFGIPIKIFDATLNNLNKENITSFF